MTGMREGTARVTAKRVAGLARGYAAFSSDCRFSHMDDAKACSHGKEMGGGGGAGE